MKLFIYDKDKHDERSRKLGIIPALLAVAGLGLTAMVTLGGFSASIENSTNSYSSGTLLLSEGNGATTCLSSPNSAGGITTNVNSSCTINDFGGATSPGAEPTNPPTATNTTITLTNTGSLSASALDLTPGSTCTVSPNPPGAGANASSSGHDTAGFCSKVDITIYNSTTNYCFYPAGAGACPALANTYNLSTLAGALPMSIAVPFASGASMAVVISVGLDSSATNADQGLTATLPLTWSLAQ
ncbi:MAG: hypothetical protein M1483_03025 [Actinobacteria bacterium]|nr:hypothetical protein [Actinomycetota bacterium]MCL6104597.1 hypothetical protein [Actinomycetota bacterium]